MEFVSLEYTPVSHCDLLSHLWIYTILMSIFNWLFWKNRLINIQLHTKMQYIKSQSNSDYLLFWNKINTHTHTQNAVYTQSKVIRIGPPKAIDLYSLTHWKYSTASIQLGYHIKDLFLLNRRRLPSWRPMRCAMTRTGRPLRWPWMKQRTAALNWNLGDGPLTETSRDSSWSWMTRRPRTRWGVDSVSVCEVDPASIREVDPYLLWRGESYCLGWIHLVWRGGSSFFMRGGYIFYMVYGHQILSTTCCRCLIDYLAPKNEKTSILFTLLPTCFL